jgi:hypothetical protein
MRGLAFAEAASARLDKLYTSGDWVCKQVSARICM